MTELPPDTPRRIASGEPDQPTQTFEYDWINMAPLPDQSIRMYRALRMFIFDKNPDWTVSLTDEEIGQLTPEAPGKPRSRWSVARALKPLFEMRLLVQLETERVSVKLPDNPKPEIRTIRTLLVNTMPPGGWEQYTGPINPFRERKRIADERRQRRADRRAGIKTPGQSDGAEMLDPPTDEPDPGTGDVSPGQSDGALLLENESTSASDLEQKCSETGAKVPRIVSNPREVTPKTKTGGPPPEPPAPAADASGPNKHRSRPSSGTSQRNHDGDHRLAHARERAGQLATDALDKDPDISRGELERLICEGNVDSNGRMFLTQGQVFGRAATLMAETHRVGRTERATAEQPALV